MTIFHGESPLQVAGLLLMTFSGCADPGEALEGVLGDDKLIWGEMTSIRLEIGRLSMNGSSSTGTLIRPKVVISAAHTLRGLSDKKRTVGRFHRGATREM